MHHFNGNSNSCIIWWSLTVQQTFGYDASMINGLNILPSYSNYFDLTTATLGLNSASIWIGGILAGLSYGKVTDIIGRRPALFWAAVITIVAVVLQTAAQNIAMFVVARILIGSLHSFSQIPNSSRYVGSRIWHVCFRAFWSCLPRGDPTFPMACLGVGHFQRLLLRW